MAEVVGVIASVITVTKALITGVELVKSMHQAEAEVQLLLERLNRFADIVAEISNRNELAQSPIITSNMASSKRTVDRLNTLIQTKVLRCSNGGQRIRRKAWLRNKSKIVALQADLELHKNTLVTAMSALTLTSSTRAEMMLNSIVGDTVSLRGSSTNADARLLEIQRLITDTRNDTMNTQAAVARIASLLEQPSGPYRHELSAPKEILLFGPLVSEAFTVAHTDGRFSSAAETQNCTHDSQADTASQGVDILQRDGTSSPQPATSLETSSHFYPTAYTSIDLVPTFIVGSYHQQSITASSRTNVYNMLLSRAPNVYQQVSMSLEVSIRSRYWKATRLSKDTYSCRDAVTFSSLFSLPSTLQSCIQRLLTGTVDIQEQSHFELLLTEGQQQEFDNLPASASLQIIRSQAQPYASSTETSAIIAHLHDMGCARYTEQEVHLLATLEPPTRYLSSVNGLLMEETKCTRYPLDQDFVYGVQSFHCLRHMPGVLNFGGAVLDRSGKHVRGFLLELPKTRCTLLLDRISEAGCTRWEDVEIWCRKLVEVVRQVHSMNFVVGSLRRYRVPILVDSYDELYLWRLEATPSFGGLHEVVHPPEFIKFHGLLDRSTPRSQIPRNTHKLDIYMLGMLLWVFAQSWAEQCTATSVRNRFRGSCKAPYMDEKRRIVQLPPMDAKVPLYFRDLVAACRKDDPSARPSATQILEILNGRESLATVVCVPSKAHPLIDIPSMWDCISSLICNNCGLRISGAFYHCNICTSGDFDICAPCFKLGKHCYSEQNHLLVEVERFQGSVTVKRYHSSVDSTGSREILEV